MIRFQIPNSMQHRRFGVYVQSDSSQEQMRWDGMQERDSGKTADKGLRTSAEWLFRIYCPNSSPVFLEGSCTHNFKPPVGRALLQLNAA